MNIYNVINRTDAFVSSEVYITWKAIILGFFMIVMAGIVVATMIWKKK